ncbi:unnamed protein product [Lymnaea stagnalis]|uniref:VWFA domain-containing protein n=1 Tax=Lymnaea stagnalis TaxID=6523 RepID=A0AAV2HNZ1_LYMST
MRPLVYIMALHIFLPLADTQHVCPPTEIVFLLDQSETALLASTDNIYDSMTYFNLVKVALDRFLLNPLIVDSPNQIRVGIFGYSSTRSGETIVPLGTSPLQALTLTHLVAKGTSAGSWTHRGLQAIQRRPEYDNNRLIIVSSMGSNSSSRRSLADKEIQRVRELGWRPLVIAVQGRNPLDMEELTMVNGGLTPVVLDDGEGRGYTRLASHLDGLVASIICVMQATLETVTQVFSSRRTTERMDLTSVCQPTEILLLLDESEAARLAASDEPDNQETKFNILKSAVDSLLANRIIANSRNTFRIGAYGYSDAGHQTVIIPEGTSPMMARDYTYLIGRNTSLKSESLTYSGLEMVRSPPFYTNNRLIVVSTRGSWSSSQRTLAQNEVARAQKLGWSPLVIAVQGIYLIFQGIYPIDTEELLHVNGGKQFVTLDDFSNLDPKSFRLLPAAFDNIVNNLLCPDSPGQETTKAQDSPGQETTKSPDSPGQETTKAPDSQGQETTKSPDSPGQETTKSQYSPGQETTKAPDSQGQETTKSPDSPGQETTKSPDSPGQETTKTPDSQGQEATKATEAIMNNVTTQSEAPMNNVTAQSVTRVETTDTSSLQSVATVSAITTQGTNAHTDTDIVSDTSHAPNTDIVSETSPAPNTDIVSETSHAPNTTTVMLTANDNLSITTANDTLSITTANDTLNITTANDTLNIFTANDSTNVTTDNRGKILSR